MLLQVWGRTLQSAEKSEAVYLPLGLSTRNSRKQADILLIAPVTTRKDDERGVYFSLQPLPSRESTNESVDAGIIFFDEDGLYRSAVVAESSQEPEDLLLRKDRRVWVDMLDPSSKDSNKILCKCRLTDDTQTVHLHGDPHRAVTIPTIFTVSYSCARFIFRRTLMFLVAHYLSFYIFVLLCLSGFSDRQRQLQAVDAGGSGRRIPSRRESGRDCTGERK